MIVRYIVLCQLHNISPLIKINTSKLKIPKSRMKRTHSWVILGIPFNVLIHLLGTVRVPVYKMKMIEIPNSMTKKKIIKTIIMLAIRIQEFLIRKKLKIISENVLMRLNNIKTGFKNAYMNNKMTIREIWNWILKKKIKMKVCKYVNNKSMLLMLITIKTMF